MKQQEVKISFGIIILNGEPFTKYCLRSLYPFAHEIIVVEGATENAKNISTSNGHSLDNTLKSLHEFKEQEDPENKVKLITRDGYWKEKDEMSKAYAEVATGNFLWQIDSDEFYLEEDMEKIISLLENKPEITAISFLQKSFWGNISYISECPIMGDVHRIFRWAKDYKYETHRPPTILNENGSNLRKINWLDGRTMANKYNIYMLHYSLLFPKQVTEKSKYYDSYIVNKFSNWAENNYFKISNPFRVHNTFYRISWLNRFASKHPQQILKMMDDIKNKKIYIQERNIDDIENLLNSKKYKTQKYLIKNYFNFLTTVKYWIKKYILKNNY